MSTISNLIFHNGKHFMSSPYGYRNSIQTSAGNTGTFHTGVDYGTYGVKLPQYAIEDGVIMSCGIDYAYGGAKYVWVKYPRINKKMLHYHLDSISVKAGQSVNKNTILGYTGATGRATGIHLHLEIHDLNTGRLNPETYSTQYKAPSTTTTTSKAKYKAGDYRVNTDLLYVRAGGGKTYRIKEFKEFSSNAQKQIKKLNNNKGCNGYVKGVEFTASEVVYNEKEKLYWGKTPSGWVCLDYCKKI